MPFAKLICVPHTWKTEFESNLFRTLWNNFICGLYISSFFSLYQQKLVRHLFENVREVAWLIPHAFSKTHLFAPYMEDWVWVHFAEKCWKYLHLWVVYFLFFFSPSLQNLVRHLFENVRKEAWLITDACRKSRLLAPYMEDCVWVQFVQSFVK